MGIWWFKFYLINKDVVFQHMFTNCIYKDYFERNEQRSYVEYICFGQEKMFELTKLSVQKRIGHPNHSPKAPFMFKESKQKQFMSN